MSDQHLQQYKDKATGILKDFFANLKALGQLLIDAEGELIASEYRELENYLKTYLTDSDLKAARAVAEGTLHPGLFPAGTKNSKVLALKPVDQKRLLSDEKFHVWNNRGDEEIKVWADMRPDERSRLLGPKGGKILPIERQIKPDGPSTSRKTVVYQNARFEGGTLSLNGGTNSGEVALGTLIATLPSTERKMLADALSA